MKLKCSLDYPSCHRCLTRGWSCEYQSRTRFQESHEPAAVSDNSSAIRDDLHGRGVDGSDSTPGPVVDSQPIESGFPMNDPDRLLRTSTPFPEGTSRDNDIAVFPELLNGINCVPVPEEAPEPFPSFINEAGIDMLAFPLQTAFQPDENLLSGFTNPQLDNGSTQSLGRGQLDTFISENLSHFRAPSERQSAPHFPPDEVGVEVPENYRNITTYGRVISALPSHPSVDDLIEFTRNYPRQMLDIEYWPPFIYHKLYRCSAGGVSESVAIALCCLSAKLNGFKSSSQFLNSMIDNERARLVDNFVSCLSSCTK